MLTAVNLYILIRLFLNRFFFSGEKYANRDTLFATSNTKISISSYEVESGLKSRNYQVGSDKQQVQNEPFTYDGKGYNKLTYYAVDNVNNKEDAKETEFFIDNTPPEIEYTYSLHPITKKKITGKTCDVLPSNSKIYLAAKDNASSVKKMYSKINKGGLIDKTLIEFLRPGNYNVEIISYDYLNNKSKKNIHFKISK